MANLIRMGEKFLDMNEASFNTEEELEKLLWENNILSNTYILQRQFPILNGSRRIDLIGLDTENIVIVEVKDEEANEEIILQVMRYAFWVEKNPDSVRSLWLQDKDKPDDFLFDWDKKPKIKIVIVAPSFNKDIKELINKINYDIELIEVKKFKDREEEFIFVNQLASQEIVPYKPSSLRYTGDYDEDFYKNMYNPGSVPTFLKIADEMEEYLKNKGWNLTRSNNKNYISFKAGFRIVCGVSWIGSRSIALLFKVSKRTSEDFNVSEFPLYRYEEQWNQALYKVESTNIDFKKLDALFENAHSGVTTR